MEVWRWLGTNRGGWRRNSLGMIKRRTLINNKLCMGIRLVIVLISG